MSEHPVTLVLLVAGIALLALLIGVLIAVLPQRSLEKKYRTESGGLGAGLDAVFSPTAFDAGTERDRQTERTAPAPAPSGPQTNLDAGRIIINIEDSLPGNDA